MFEYDYVWFTDGPMGEGEKPLEPYLLSCHVPKTHQNKTPTSVSLVERQCERVTNNLKVTYKPLAKEPKQDFAVCVKAFNIPDDDDGRPTSVSDRIIEWIELMSILGAKKIFFYNLTSKLHQNVRKVGKLSKI